MLLFLGVFFGIVGLVYWFWSYDDGGGMMLAGHLTPRLPPRELLLVLAPQDGKTGRRPGRCHHRRGFAGDINSFPELVHLAVRAWAWARS